MKKIIIILTCFLIQSINLLCQTIGGIKGGSSLTVTNTIVCGNEGTSQSSSTITGTNNIIQSNILSNFKDVMVAPLDTFSYYLSPTSTLRNAGINISGIPSKDLNGNDRTYDTTIDIGAVEYSEIYQNGSGTWNTVAGWNTGRIPTTDDVVTIRSATTVNSTDAVCKSIINIESGASLTINPAAQLIVSTSVSNTSSDRLIIKSSTTQPNGTLIFHNTSYNPYATVEMNTKASWNSTGVLDTETNTRYYYNWQFFGIPVSSITASPTFDGSFVRKWDETGKTKSDHWVSLTNGSIMQAFTGYEITQKSVVGNPINFQGQLVNMPFNSNPLSISYYPLNMANNALFPGQYIFSNPYTAAIDIKQLKFGTGAQNTVYMFNTGSFATWNSINGVVSSDSTLFVPGQYIAVPFNTAGNAKLPRQIPSMQAFLIRPKDVTSAVDYNLSFDYSSVVMKNIAQQRVSNITDTTSQENICMIIDVAGKNSMDRMWLFSQSDCTRNFDNGWDGAKIQGDAVTPQIFAIEPDNNYQVDAVEDMNNTVLGFQAGEDKDYTLSFTHQNLASKYSGVFLIDLIENKTIDITESGSTYSFQAETTPNASKRFLIATRRIDTTIPDSTQIRIVTSGNIVIVQNLSNQNGAIDLYDSMGRKQKNGLLSSYGITTLQVNELSGTYIVTVTVGTERTVKKIILTR